MTIKTVIRTNSASCYPSAVSRGLDAVPAGVAVVAGKQFLVAARLRDAGDVGRQDEREAQQDRALAHPRRRYYAPWRDHPRPAVGLLQGAYAHVGVTEFWWRRRKSALSAARSHLAHWKQRKWS